MRWPRSTSSTKAACPARKTTCPVRQYQGGFLNVIDSFHDVPIIIFRRFTRVIEEKSSISHPNALTVSLIVEPDSGESPATLVSSQPPPDHPSGHQPDQRDTQQNQQPPPQPRPYLPPGPAPPQRHSPAGILAAREPPREPARRASPRRVVIMDFLLRTCSPGDSGGRGERSLAPRHPNSHPAPTSRTRQGSHPRISDPDSVRKTRARSGSGQIPNRMGLVRGPMVDNPSACSGHSVGPGYRARVTPGQSPQAATREDHC